MEMEEETWNIENTGRRKNTHTHMHTEQKNKLRNTSLSIKRNMYRDRNQNKQGSSLNQKYGKELEPNKNQP